jgi:hypothetical protein
MAKRSYIDRKNFVVPTDRTPRRVYRETSPNYTGLPFDGGSKATKYKQHKDGSIRKPKRSW